MHRSPPETSQPEPCPTPTTTSRPWYGNTEPMHYEAPLKAPSRNSLVRQRSRSRSGSNGNISSNNKNSSSSSSYTEQRNKQPHHNEPERCLRKIRSGRLVRKKSRRRQRNAQGQRGGDALAQTWHGSSGSSYCSAAASLTSLDDASGAPRMTSRRAFSSSSSSSRSRGVGRSRSCSNVHTIQEEPDLEDFYKHYHQRRCPPTPNPVQQMLRQASKDVTPRKPRRRRSPVPVFLPTLPTTKLPFPPEQSPSQPHETGSRRTNLFGSVRQELEGIDRLLEDDDDPNKAGGGDEEEPAQSRTSPSETSSSSSSYDLQRVSHFVTRIHLPL